MPSTDEIAAGACRFIKFIVGVTTSEIIVSGRKDFARADKMQAKTKRVGSDNWCYDQLIVRFSESSASLND